MCISPGFRALLCPRVATHCCLAHDWQTELKPILPGREAVPTSSHAGTRHQPEVLLVEVASQFPDRVWSECTNHVRHLQNS